MKQKGKRNPGVLVLVALLVGMAANAVFAHSGNSAMQSAPGVEAATPALSGYDPVAYFDEGRPVRGSGYHTADFKGVTYLFASESHQKKFLANPGRYAPQYGGYCAYGVAVGKKFHSDPHAWKIVNGKLYLNLDRDIQKKWNQDIRGYIAKAETNWQEIEFKAPAEL